MEFTNTIHRIPNHNTTHSGFSSGRKYFGRWAILWGGGLGDLLVIRPLLLALAQHGNPPPVYMTTANHLPTIFEEMGLRCSVWRLPRDSFAALAKVRSAGTFDMVYTGPQNTLRTMLLSLAIRSRRRSLYRLKERKVFLCETIGNDLLRFGFFASKPRPYGPTPFFPNPAPAEKVNLSKPYLVLHPGSKAAWQTTRWPSYQWAKVVARLCRMRIAIVLVGTPDEKNLLRKIWIDSGAHPSVSIITNLKLHQLESVVKNASGVLCHNSGIMHLATAYQKRTVVLTGSSAHKWRPPYQWVRNITSGLCQIACNKYRCPIPFYKARCITHISFTDVMQTLECHILSHI